MKLVQQTDNLIHENEKLNTEKMKLVEQTKNLIHKNENLNLQVQVMQHDHHTANIKIDRQKIEIDRQKIEIDRQKIEIDRQKEVSKTATDVLRSCFTPGQIKILMS